ncbi:MAG: tRNA-dihydrouridine synthase [Planctomycetia bacterium]|nr:tRNA-dihydrouridine synthase [Planctomycetia bacterium]
MQLGSLTISPPLFQAPMAGFTNDAFRQMVTQFGGVGLLATEMLHARGLLEMSRRRKSLHGRLFGIPRHDEALPKVPLAVQIWDNDAEAMAAVTEKILQEFAVQVIDMNFGCPMPDVVQKAKAGSWLLQFPEKMAEIARCVVQAAGATPVTAKIRLGFTAETVNAVENALALEEAGIQALTVHGRTTEQMYSGTADWGKIAEVKRALKKIPLIGNGDIRTPEDAVRAFRDYGVDGVMIGRQALKHPWIFRQTERLLRGDTTPMLPTATEQKTWLLEHFRLLRKQYSEQEAILLMRRVAPCYGSGLRNARHFRIAVGKSVTEQDFYEAVETFFPTDISEENSL